MSQLMPGQGSMNHLMTGQGTMSQQMPGQGTTSQQMSGQAKMGQHMPGQGTRGQQMPGQGTISHQMPVQGSRSHQMSGQGIMSHPMPVISSQYMVSQFSGAVTHSVSGQGVPSMLNPHIPAIASLGQQMPGYGTGTMSKPTATQGKSSLMSEAGQRAMNQQIPNQQQAMTNVQSIHGGGYTTQADSTHGQPGTMASQIGYNHAQPHVTSQGSLHQTSIGQPHVTAAVVQPRPANIQPKVSTVEVHPQVPQPVVLQPQHSPSKPQSIAAAATQSSLALLSSLSLPSTSTE